MNVRADRVKADFEHMHKNEHNMQLYATSDFAVVEIVAGEVTPSERASINAKNDPKNSLNDAYECPKIGCGRQMWKIKSGDFECGQCSGNYATFEFREQPQIDEVAAIPEQVTPKASPKAKVSPKSTPKSASSNKRGKSPSDEKSADEAENGPKRRLRRRI